MSSILVIFSVCFGIVLAYGVIRLATAYFEHKYRNNGEN